jgi:formylglycine-generating enzyme required for sulfatase activity/dienelactone hydrolase
MIGETISHYRILELLGAGGMGVVYKAEDTRLRRTVALKFLPLEMTQDPDAKERLRLEAQTASALDHPNICTIHEIDETADGRVFVAMAYYEGETLKQRIARGQVAIDEALRIGAETARAVAAAHDAGVVHRDIKPANIMLTKRGEVKLLDFGVAKLSGRTALTRTGVTVGTIAYMAPEHVMGQPADQQSDVWALGVVLYEMLAGRLPFEGEHEIATINAIANQTAPPLRQLRADVPVELQQIVDRALQKSRAARYGSMSEMQHDLDALRGPSTQATRPLETSKTAVTRKRDPRIAMAAGVVLILLAALGSWWAYHASRVRSARAALPQFRALIDAEKFSTAFRMLHEIERYLSGDPEFEAVRRTLLVPGTIRTTPDGADLYLRGYDEPEAAWMFVGRSPLEQFRLPLGYFRWRAVKPGYTSFEGSAGGGFEEVTFSLLPEGAIPEGMVNVPKDAKQYSGTTAPVDAFYIDRYEISNRQFKQFVDAGGYSARQYWREPFIKDGRTLTWEEAMAELRDTTGRPGPSTWELGTYLKGQDDHPVTGVSWYEALAYAAWAGKELPTVHHWRKAAPGGIFSEILDYSNFSNKQAAPVGAYKGIGDFGTYDMAGNVREWCRNAVRSQRYILGGAWNEPNYMYQSPDAADPFDRSAINGFRLMKRTTTDAMPAALLAPIEELARDYRHVTPVSGAEFEIYRRLYAYDPSDLKPVLESTDDSSESWRVERVTYAAAYGGERIPAYLFLPRHVSPPYQTVVYFPHSGGEYLRSFEQSEMNYLGFIVKAGRALLFPMYKGTYERRLERPPDGPNARRDLMFARMKDLQRSVDYLFSRRDIDHDRLAYFGVSLGARLGNISLAIEKRFKTAVLWSGGFRTTPALSPEIDDVNFAPRVTTPVLMLNGRQDFTFPIETSQVPMFKLLGTPAADKRHIIYDGGHVFPFARIIKDTLDWLDRYLGVPK